MKLFGGLKGGRTPDLCIANAALYQLSYKPNAIYNITKYIFVNTFLLKKYSKYYSDAYSAYAEVCYEGVPTSLKNNTQTYTVEGVNSDLRHYIPSLHRRSKCFFRSIETMNAVFEIFVNAFNKFALAKFLYHHFKSAFALSYFL